MFFDLSIYCFFLLGVNLGASFPTLQARKQSDYDPYPTDDQIARDFTGIGRDQTVVFEGLGPMFSHLAEFVEFIHGKSIIEAFPTQPTSYMFLGNRDPEGYDAFIRKIREKLYGESSGTVWLLSPEEFLFGENDCGTWSTYEFDTLIRNPNVDEIEWVDPTNFLNRLTYWKREDEKPGENEPPQSQPGQPLPQGGPTMGIAIPAISGAGAFGGNLIGVPGSGPWTIQRPNDVDQPDPGVKADVLPSTVGDLPVEENSVQPGDSTTAASDQSSTSGQGMSGRRSLHLRRRKNCPPAHPDWVSEPSLPDSPDISRIQLHVQSTSPSTADPESSPWTTVKVTQYWEPYTLQGILGKYTIDVSLINSDGVVIGGVFGVQAPNDEPVPVRSSLPLPFYVTMGTYLEDALKLQYGDQGRQWSSQDASHRCRQGQWRDNKRQSQCQFRAALETAVPRG